MNHDRRNGTIGLGKRLYCLDTVAGKAWVRLPDLPSAARWLSSVSVIGTEIFVLGGATGSNPQHAITTLADNWKYNTVTRTWTQLAS